MHTRTMVDTEQEYSRTKTVCRCNVAILVYIEFEWLSNEDRERAEKRKDTDYHDGSNK